MMENIDFEKLKQIIIPYFIEIYGNEYQDIIIERISKIQPIFYNTLDSKKSRMNKLEMAKKVELTLKFLELNNIQISEELKNEMVKNNSTYRLSEVSEAYKLLNACFGTTCYTDLVYGGIKSIVQEPTEVEYDKKRSIDALRKIGIEVEVDNYNEWVLTQEAKEKFEQINRLKSLIGELDLEYNEFDNQFVGLKVSINKADEFQKELEEKYMLEFLKSLEQELSVTDKKTLEDYINADKRNFYRFKSEMEVFKLFGDSFSNNGVLEAFSSEASRKLNDSSISTFEKEAIIEKRIKYYKMIEVYDNQISPEEFLSTERAIANAIPSDKADSILLEKESFKQKKEEEYLIATSNYRECLDKVERLNLITDHGFDISVIENGVNCISPTVSNINGVSELVPLLFFSPDKCTANYVDVMFIHEINHVIETTLISYNGDKPLYKTGYEFLTDADDEKRNYELFSEMQNQLIAMEITEAMHRDNIYLFDNPNTSKIKGGTSYENYRFFVEGFYQTFKKEIIASRVDRNLDSLFKVVGKDNFERLNDNINEYSQLPYLKMMSDVVAGRTTELTEKRQKLRDDTVVTLNLMCEYFEQVSSYEDKPQMVM